MEPIQPKWIKSPSFSSRRDREISAILFRATGHMSLQRTVKLMSNPGSRFSAHYLVARNSEEGVIQMVDTRMKAWHAGKAILWRSDNVNAFSVGLQLVGTTESGYTDYQYEASAMVCAHLMDQEPAITFNRILGLDAITEGPLAVGPGGLWRWDRFFDILARKLYGLAIERP